MTDLLSEIDSSTGFTALKKNLENQEKNLENLKQGNHGKLMETSWKIIVARENSGKIFKLLFNLLILKHCVVHNLGHNTMT